MSKKILIVTEVFYPESGLINDFAQELCQRGYTVEVLTQHPSYPGSYVYDGYTNDEYSTEQWNGILIHRFKLVEGYKTSIAKKILNYKLFVKKGSEIAKKIGNDYDHILVYQTGPLTVALPAIAIKKKFNKKVTIWTFDIWPDAVYAYGFPKIFPLTSFLDRLIKRIYSKSDNILVSSEGFIDSVKKYVDNKDVQYAPNWPTEEIAQKSEVVLAKDKFNFSFTGNISISQNLKNVLLGWKKANLTHAVLNIVGDGSYLPVLQELVRDQRIANVVFHGRHPSNQMPDILQQSDFLILSLVDDYGIDKTEPYKIQSYLKAKKPILGIIKGGGKKIIENYSLGLCSDPSDINQIALSFDAAMKFVQEKDKLEQVKLSAEDLLLNRFNREKIIDKVIAVIEK